MGAMESFMKKYHLYEKGHITKEAFGYHMYYTGSFEEDMLEVIFDYMGEMDLNDLAAVNNFFDSSPSISDRLNIYNFSMIVDSGEYYNKLPNTVLERIKDDLDLIKLVRYNKLNKEELFERADDDDWETLFLSHIEYIYNMGYTADDILKIVETIDDEKIQNNIIDFLKTVLSDENQFFEKWKDHETLRLMLKVFK